MHGTRIRKRTAPGNPVTRTLFIALTFALIILLFLGTVTADVEVNDIYIDDDTEEVYPGGTASYFIGFEFRANDTGPNTTDVTLGLNVPSGGWSHEFDGASSWHIEDDGWRYISLNVTAPSYAERNESFTTYLFLNNSNGTNPQALNLTTAIPDYSITFDINDLDARQIIEPESGEEEATFWFEIANTGDLEDDYRVRASGFPTNLFEPIPEQRIKDILPGDYKTVTLNLSYRSTLSPNDVQAGQYDVEVTVTSDRDAKFNRTTTLTLVVEEFEGISLGYFSDKDVGPDEDNIFEIRMDNIGNDDVDVELSVADMDPMNLDWITFYKEQELFTKIVNEVTVPFDSMVSVFMNLRFTREEALSEQKFTSEDTNDNRIDIYVSALTTSGESDDRSVRCDLERIVSYDIDLLNTERTFEDPEIGDRVLFDIKIANTGVRPEDFELSINDVPEFLDARFYFDDTVTDINNLRSATTKTVIVDIDTEDISNLPVDDTYKINVSVRPLHGQYGPGAPRDAKEQSFDLEVHMAPKGVPEITITGAYIQSVLPGKNVTYNLRISNEGNEDDDMVIGISSSEALYGTINGQTQLTIDDMGPGDYVNLPYVVNISKEDAEARKYSSIEETVTVYSSVGNYISESYFIETPIEEFDYDVNMTIESKQKEGEPGDLLTYRLTVENMGDTTQDVEVMVQQVEDPGPGYSLADVAWVELAGNNKTATNSLTLEALDPGIPVAIEMDVRIPTNFKQAQAGTYLYRVSAHSAYDPNAVAHYQVKAIVSEMHDVGLTVTPSGDIRTIDPTGTDGDNRIDYTIRIKNLGNTDDRFTVSTLGLPPDLVAKFSGLETWTSPEIEPDETATTFLYIDGALYYDPGTYTFDVLATGSKDADDRISLAVKVLKGDLVIGDITVENGADLKEGDDAVISVRIENRGASEISDLDIYLMVNGWEIDVETEDIPAKDTRKFNFDLENIKAGPKTIVIRTEHPDGDFDQDKTLTGINPEGSGSAGAYESIFSSNPIGPIIIIILVVLLVIFLFMMYAINTNGGRSQGSDGNQRPRPAYQPGPRYEDIPYIKPSRRPPPPSKADGHPKEKRTGPAPIGSIDPPKKARKPSPIRHDPGEGVHPGNVRTKPGSPPPSVDSEPDPAREADNDRTDAGNDAAVEIEKILKEMGLEKGHQRISR